MENENVFDIIKKNFDYNKTNKVVQDLVTQLKQYDPLKVLYDLTIFYMKNDSSRDKAKGEMLNSIIYYVQSIYASNFCENNKNYHIDKLSFDIAKVIWETNYFLEFDLLNHSSVNFSSRMYEISFGRTYPILVPVILNNLLYTQDSLLKKVYGIDHENVVLGLKKISESLFRIGKLVSDKKDVPYEMFNVKKVTGWPDEFINDLSWSLGSCTDYSTKDKYANWFNIEMPSKTKPFIKINNDSYFFDLGIVNDCLYRSIQKVIHTKDIKYIEEWKRNQQIASESFGISLLTSVFKDSLYYKNNFYKSSDGKITENDGLIMFNNVLLIVEVKAGSYTPRSVLTDPNSHSIAKSNLINNPLTQCERFINALNKFSKIDIYQDEKLKAKKYTIKKSDFNYIIPISITLEPLGEIHVMYKDSSLKSFLSISIADLTIYSMFFNDEPVLFIHYLIQRIKEIKVENFVINDELDYLGSYLKNRNFNSMYNNAKNMGSIFVDNMHEDIDKCFMCLNKEPSFNISNFIHQFINKAEKSLNRDTLNMLLSILDQDDEFLDNFEKSVSYIINRQSKINKFSTMTVFTSSCNFIPIQIFANDIRNKMSTDKHALLYALAVMEAYNYSKMYYMIIDKNHNNIERVSIRLVDSNTLSEVNMFELETVKGHMKYNQQIISFTNSSSNKKVGRNDLCPCGSGKKYKKCCLLKKMP